MEKEESKIGGFLKKWSVVVAVPFILLATFKSCDTNSDLSRLRKENNSLKESVDSLIVRTKSLEDKQISNKNVRDIMEEVMLDFLIYEDELDKNKITVSQIKDKIKAND